MTILVISHRKFLEIVIFLERFDEISLDFADGFQARSEPILWFCLDLLFLLFWGWDL